MVKEKNVHSPWISNTRNLSTFTIAPYVHMVSLILLLKGKVYGLQVLKSMQWAVNSTAFKNRTKGKMSERFAGERIRIVL